MVAIISLLLIITLSILITRIATIALAHTGLSKESARFQARSAFTGVGFTTTESEQVASHPVRRRIVMVLMLLGNAGIVTSVSSLMLTFLTPGEEGLINIKFLVLFLGLFILWWASRSHWIDNRLSIIIDRALTKYSNLDTRDYGNLLHLTGDYRVSELKVESDDWIANRTLQDLRLQDEGILILGVMRSNGDYLGAPNGSTVINSDDMVILYGRDPAIESLDERRHGLSGDQAHAQAVEEQKKVEQEEETKNGEASGDD